VRAVGLARALLLLTLLAPADAWSIKLPLKPDTFLDFHLLLQPWMQLRQDLGARPQLQNDFFVRRARLMLGGQVTKWVSFFAETDQPNWGKGGDWKTSTFYMQDAFINLNLHEAFVIDGGMLIIPFIHQARQGATTLHTLDYHTDLIKYPKDSTKVWRDMGVQLRGLLARKTIAYHVAVTNGVGNTPKDTPRVSGRIGINFLDAEDTSFFFGGTYLGAKKLLSVGAAFDVQQGAFGEGTSYYAFGGDVFLDLPLRHKRRVSGQLDVAYYGGEKNPDKGIGFLFDLGYAIGNWEPMVVVDWFRPDGADELKAQLLGIHGGLAWWVMGHSVNLKLDIGFVKQPGVEMWRTPTVITLGSQLYL